MQLDEKLLIISKARNNFGFFINNIFCHSIDIFKDKEFVGGKHIDNIADYLQNNKKTRRVSARFHFKSVSFYAHFMWQLLRYVTRGLEAHYFSYNYSMAAYHTAKIKKAIECNPFFDELIDKKKTAESILKYSWDDEHFITIEPHGLLEFKRGIHCPLIYVDDPFQDPASKLLITNINKINNIIKTEILDMTWDQLHIAGTPQTNDDFFFDKDLDKYFATLIQPAIKDEKNKKVLWPEWMDFKQLIAKKEERGERIFNQEYQCNPAYSEDAYLKREQLMAVVKDIINLDIGKKYESEYDVICGWDIGKKVHPAHFTVFEVIKGKKEYQFKQIHEKFMDGWEYNRQLEYVALAIENFGIDLGWYDDTRGELQSFEEEGRLPAQLEPIVFSLKSKSRMAAALDKLIYSKQIELINDKRMLGQMLNVDNNLKSIESPEGHGDSFWSCALCTNYIEGDGTDITFI